MSEFTPWRLEAVGKRAVEALRGNNFEAEYCATKEEAAERVLSLVPEGASVGFGGSWTVKALGVSEGLARRPCSLRSRSPGDQEEASTSGGSSSPATVPVRDERRHP